jgi:hypothetical protein
LLGLSEPFVGLAHPGVLGVAFIGLPPVARDTWPPSTPRRPGHRLGVASTSLGRTMPARSSADCCNNEFGEVPVPQIWAGVDIGNLTRVWVICISHDRRR